MQDCLVQWLFPQLHALASHLYMRVWGARPLPATRVLLTPVLAGLPAATICCVLPSTGNVRLRERDAVPACVARTKPSRACIPSINL